MDCIPYEPVDVVAVLREMLARLERCGCQGDEETAVRVALAAVELAEHLVPFDYEGAPPSLLAASAAYRAAREEAGR